MRSLTNAGTVSVAIVALTLAVAGSLAPAPARAEEGLLCFGSGQNPGGTDPWAVWCAHDGWASAAVTVKPTSETSGDIHIGVTDHFVCGRGAAG